MVNFRKSTMHGTVRTLTSGMCTILKVGYSELQPCFNNGWTLKHKQSSHSKPMAVNSTWGTAIGLCGLWSWTPFHPAFHLAWLQTLLVHPSSLHLTTAYFTSRSHLTVQQKWNITSNVLIRSCLVYWGCVILVWLAINLTSPSENKPAGAMVWRAQFVPTRRGTTNTLPLCLSLLVNLTKMPWFVIWISRYSICALGVKKIPPNTLFVAWLEWSWLPNY